MAFCLFACFVNPLSEPAKANSRAGPPSPKGTLVNVPKPVTAPVLQQGLHSAPTPSWRPLAQGVAPHRPARCLHNHAKVLVLLVSPWASRWCLILSGSVHTSPCLLCPPATPNQAGWHLPCLGWGKKGSGQQRWAHRAAGPRLPIKADSTPAPPLERIWICVLPPPFTAEPFSLVCVSPNSLERASKNAH